MSIKKLFSSTDKSRNYLSDTNQKDAFTDVESARNVEALKDKQQAFVPQIDYANPANFARYGSAYLYYKSAIERILDFYPYDGSDAELNEFYNKSLDIEKYIFNNLYPRTTGYVKISADGWGAQASETSGYGLPSTLEYIEFRGGPGTSSGDTYAAISPNPMSSKFQYSNVYDTNPYQTAGLQSDYGVGSRESNLKSNFDTGVTIEFWLTTGSANTTYSGGLSDKQIVVDIWNNKASAVGTATADDEYGRITLELNASASSGVSPLELTVHSGSSAGIFQETIGGSLIDVDTLSAWHHYAITIFNSGSDLGYELYLDGLYKTASVFTGQALGELQSKEMMGRLGALMRAPKGTSAGSGSAKLSGSMDEFRFWKARRTAKEIGQNWNTQIGGGVNTDISNMTLGLYYKFNAGITGDSSIDSNVLDYGGRICNGAWTGYSSNSRNTGSAIMSASAAPYEYLDPIIYASHPDVVNLKTGLLDSGSYHDANNNSAVLSMLPEWVIADSGDTDVTDLRVLTHIVGTYFDKLYLQIEALTSFKNSSYTSSSYQTIPFSNHLPQSLGLYTPEIFVDANVLETFVNRDATSIFEGDVEETKNLIYLNLYNNIAEIYKGKGTEKAIRNILRCFNLDQSLLRLNIYANDNTYELKNNLQQTFVNRSALNLNEADNFKGVVYQAVSGTSTSNGDALGYISGSQGAGYGYEFKYGFTAESDIKFPGYDSSNDKFNRFYHTASLFGMYTVDTGSADSLSGENTGWVSSYTVQQPDFANFQVVAVRDVEYSKNAYFRLTSSNHPHYVPELTSSLFFDVYDNSEWNFSVRLKPSNYPYTSTVSGTYENYNYDLIFRGINTELGTVVNNFELTSSLTRDEGRDFLKSAKRLYAGARRTDITGALLNYSDVMVNSVRYWAKYLHNDVLNQHSYDFENHGITGSYQFISPLDINNTGSDALNAYELALNWNFANVTSSDATGQFVVADNSSGSALIRDNFGWLGNLVGYQHTGYGYLFGTSSSSVVEVAPLNSFKFVNPEMAISDDMVRIMTEEDELFGITETVPNFVYVLEKSMYNAISEEMLKFFGGVVDFNNIIGSPVNRYRGRYKEMEKLREIFFRRVTKTSKVEKFIDYYKWFDDALSAIIAQLVPASSDFVPDVYNVVESHVLERNKYQTKFPQLETKSPEPAAAATSPVLSREYKTSRSPVSPSLRSTKINRFYWQRMAERGATEITSGDATVDSQRDTIRDVAWSQPTLSQSLPVFSEADGTTYSVNTFAVRNDQNPIEVEFEVPRAAIKGGVNFKEDKNIAFTYNAVYPAGPINTEDSVFLPENVLVAFVDDFTKLPEDTPDLLVKDPNKKLMRYGKVIHGRDYEDGGYANTKNSFSFPFNILSSSVSGGYSNAINERVSGNLNIVNLHNDVYGPDMEVPMQGPFTNYAVGGHQSRHISLNTGSDEWYNRPEAWKLLLGTCAEHTGALGLVGADYPWPEANEEDVVPYPMTASQKAVYYRDMTAKRPVNIKNILNTTGSNEISSGSSVLGNYQHIYQVVNSVGAHSNPRNFVKNQPTLPTQVVWSAASSSVPTNIRTFWNTRRGVREHHQWVSEYSTDYLTGATNKSIITQRFAAPGGIEVMSYGYQSFRASEYSVYNALNYRNLSVIKPSQGATSSFYQAVGSGTTGIRVFDIHGRDYGLRSHMARHAARFGRDSFFVTSSGDMPGAKYDQLPAMFKNNRNTKIIPCSVEEIQAVMSGSTLTNSKALSGSLDTATYEGNCLLIENSAKAEQRNFDGNMAIASGNICWTWSGWYKSDRDTTNRCLLSMGLNGGGASNYRVEHSHKFTMVLQSYNGSSYRGTTIRAPDSNTWPQNTWTHVLLSITGSQGSLSTTFSASLYYDGVEQGLELTNTPYDYLNTASATDSNFRGFGALDPAGPFVIGGRFNNDSTNEYIGMVDELALFATCSSTSDAVYLYNSGKPCDLTASVTPHRNELLSWWRMGDNALDGIVSGRVGETTSSATNRIIDQVGEANLLAICKSGSLVGMATASAGLSGCTATHTGWHEATTYATCSLFDNFSIGHMIPRADRQYSWVTASLASGSNALRYYGRAPVAGTLDGYYSSSADGLVSYFNFVTASEVMDSSYPTFNQPTYRLNTFIVEPITSSTNTMGYPSGSPMLAYYNGDLADDVGVTPANVTDGLLNLILTHRKSTYGWNWTKARQGIENPIILKEVRENKLSVVGNLDTEINTYRLAPISLRGRPTIINMTVPSSGEDATAGRGLVSNNVTLRTTNNNNKIFFNETALDNFTGIGTTQPIITPTDQLIAIANSPTSNGAYALGGVLYSENVFPSLRNEFMSSTTGRVDYDNKFWRDNRDARTVAYGTVGDPTLTDQVNSFSVLGLSQSMWVLDAPYNFNSRTEPPSAISYSDRPLLTASKAGELQNTYFSYVRANPSVGPVNFQAIKSLRPGALYSRKHILPSPRSVVSPSGMIIRETGSVPTASAFIYFNTDNFAIDMFAGEANWQANTDAGIVVKAGSSAAFSSYPSNPWFNNYDDYNFDLKNAAKGYAIIPEFRISEHVEDYVKYGILNEDKQDTFEIPGTSINSTTSSFYKDYSNSEFLKGFAQMSDDSLLNAKEIRLVCSASIRFNPYKGFYPAQRSLDVVSQFSRSYGDGLTGWLPGTDGEAESSLSATQVVSVFGGASRPLMDALYSPGLLYNAMKSGMAVDYPLVTDENKIKKAFYGTAVSESTDSWALCPQLVDGETGTITGYRGGEYWDMRLPFETLLEPEKYISKIPFYDIEAHPSMSLNATASFNGQSIDNIYSLMADNFFGEVGNFFLKDGGYTTLKSNTVTDSLRFQKDAVYGARLKLYRSTTGPRTYQYESGAMSQLGGTFAANNTGFGKFGALLYSGSNAVKIENLQSGSEFPIPQDPQKNPEFHETFTMYSRPTAFGPSISGRPSGSDAGGSEISGTLDSFNGCNWAFTPPYYNGEAWVDFVFRPRENTSYDLESILAETSASYWRIDPGYNINTAITPDTLLIKSYGFPNASYGSDVSLMRYQIYDGANVNLNAMQISASINIFGIEDVAEQEIDKFGNEIKTINKSVGKRWVIQPKFETPMLNFNDTGVRPITASEGTITMPTNYGSASVPRGMWHQFGVIPETPNKGVFMEMTDIPNNWLKYHYDIVNKESVYNNFSTTTGSTLYQDMGSLVDLTGFNRKTSKARLGELAEKQTLKEAIVAIPYVVENGSNAFLGTQENISGEQGVTNKKFFEIPQEKYEAAMAASEGSAEGDSLETAGTSIRSLVQKMQNYILPPQFDFVNNSDVEPIAMYIFEFTYDLDKDDLSYIWQNVAPRNYKKITLTAQSTAHNLANNELLDADDLMNNANVRWMVFKVKQRSQKSYFDGVAPQVGQAVSTFDIEEASNQYKIGFNWPYDYVSFVESIKMDVEVLYKNESGQKVTTRAQGAGIGGTTREGILNEPGD